MSDKVIDILWKDQLDALLSQQWIVFVDFWAEWCGPCRMLGPVLHDIAEKNTWVVIAKVNVDADQNADLSMEFGVRSIPQVNIFKNGEQVDQFVWALPPDQVQKYVDTYSWE